MATIKFYGIHGEHGYMSNFSRHSYKRNGRLCKTSEHDFQAEKFAGTPLEKKVLDAANAKEAKKLGQSSGIRKDWEKVKEKIMKECLLAKFRQHPQIMKHLLDTGDAELIEDAPYDYYWGCGADGSGKNRLGIILMEVRSELRKK